MTNKTFRTLAALGVALGFAYSVVMGNPKDHWMVVVMETLLVGVMFFYAGATND